MKTIGLIGGMSWESSRDYYQFINDMVKDRIGEPHSAPIIMYSVDFAEFKQLQHAGNWQKLKERMINIARKLENAGADMLIICANTMHRMAEEISSEIDIPLIHIADTAAKAIKFSDLEKAGLLGTKFTMEQDFYKQRLQQKHDIEVVIPEQNEREIVHNIIYDELISGIIKEESRQKIKSIIAELQAEKEAQGIILGCTELPMLITEKDSDIPVFNTTRLHAQEAVRQALT